MTPALFPLFPKVDTKDLSAVFAQADTIYRQTYDDANEGYMDWARSQFESIFSGAYQDFQPIDVPYHDREHTMQGMLCLVRLLHCRHRTEDTPVVDRKRFELGVLAILLHDSGYLKHASDTEGTGAKYTLIHVDRSRVFADGFMRGHGYRDEEILAVQNMIQCTATGVSLEGIPFRYEEERIVGYSLATADLLGQMAADDYLQRLPELYREFMECYGYFGKAAEHLYYPSEEQLITNTPGFWEGYVLPKLNQGCEGLYKYLNQPYPDGNNEYIASIEANLDKLR